MKHIILISLLCIFLISIENCKKCATCSNICYSSTIDKDTVCSNDFYSMQQFDTVVAILGARYHKITPTKSQKICDSKGSLTNLKQLLESQNFVCTNN